MDALQQASYKVYEEMYKKAGAGSQQGPEQPYANGAEKKDGKQDEDVIDAEFKTDN